MRRIVHTCYCITDPGRSLSFYEILGFELRRELRLGEATNHYFLGMVDHPEPELQLTHHIGTAQYEHGTGYSHVALEVDRLDGVLADLARHEIHPERPPYRVVDGGSRICFVRDPDGYRIELLERPTA